MRALVLVLAAAMLQAQSPVAPVRRVVSGAVELHHAQLALYRAPQWSLEARPMMVAGGIDDPDHDLTAAQFVELMPDGSLVTLAPVGSRLFWFPAGGRGARSLSRQGQGPGELMAPLGMGRVGDTVVINDAANNRANWVIPSKGFVVTIGWPNLSLRPRQFAGALRGGQLVFRGLSGPFQAVDSISRSPASILVAQPRAASVVMNATVPDYEGFGSRRGIVGASAVNGGTFGLRRPRISSPGTRSLRRMESRDTGLNCAILRERSCRPSSSRDRVVS